MNTLIAYIKFHQTTGTYIYEETNQIMKIDPYVTPFSPKPDPRHTKDIPSGHNTKMTIFPMVILVPWRQWSHHMPWGT